MTPDYVYQVSDRRLVWLNGPQAGRVKDDERNKAVLIDGRFSFGYTGLAELGSQRTDEWLVRIVADGPTSDMAEVLARIRDRATESFRAVPLPPPLRRHAFQGVGWVFRRGSEGRPIPGVITVANALGRDGKWLPAAEDAFESRVKLYEALPNGFDLRSVGQEIKPNEQATIWRFIRRSARRSAPPAAFVRSLVISLRWLSRRYSTIGPGLMVVSLPKRAAQRFAETGQMRALLGGPLEHDATFLYVSSDGQRTVFYGPHAVTAGMPMMNFTVTPLPPKDGP